MRKQVIVRDDGESVQTNFKPTGNAAKDTKSLKQAISAKGLEKQSAPLHAVTQTARSFRGATELMFQYWLAGVLPRQTLTGNGNEGILQALCVNAAFCVECHLKVLHMECSSNADLRTHDLVALFRDLPEAVKDLIRECAVKVAPLYEFPLDASVEEQLGNIRLAFELWRYPWDHHNLPFFDIKRTRFVIESLHDACVAKGLET